MRSSCTTTRATYSASAATFTVPGSEASENVVAPADYVGMLQRLAAAAERLRQSEDGSGPPLTAQEVDGMADHIALMADSCHLATAEAAAATDDATAEHPGTALARQLAADAAAQDSLLTVLTVAAQLTAPHSGAGGVHSGSSADGGSVLRSGGSDSSASGGGASGSGGGRSGRGPTCSGVSGSGSQGADVGLGLASAAADRPGLASSPASSAHPTQAATGCSAQDPGAMASSAWRLWTQAADLLLCADNASVGLLLSPTAVGFAHRLLQTQVLQCCSRRAAGASAAALAFATARAGKEEAGGQPPVAAAAVAGLFAAEGPRAGDVASPGSRPPEGFWEATGALWCATDMLHRLSLLAQATAYRETHDTVRSAEDACPAYVSELASALRDSCLLEHAAQALLLATESVEAAEACDIRDTLAAHCLLLSETLCMLQVMRNTLQACCLATHHLFAEALSGRCVSHFLTSLAVAALAEADGGPTYGMPPELRRMVAGLADFTSSDADTLFRQRLNGSCLPSLAMHLRSRRRAPPPGRRASVALLLRVGRMALAAAREEAEDVERPEASGYDQQAVQCCCSDASSDTEGQLQAEAQGSRRSMDPTATPALLVQIVCSLDALLPAARQSAGGWAAEEAAERWRLAVAATRDAVRWADDEGMSQLGAALQLDMGQEEAGPLPPRTPALSAALAGGLLPCLERLLRRAAEAPDGPEAAVLAASQDGAPALFALLMHGDPRAAAALVASTGKALRRWGAQLLDCMQQRAVGSAGEGQDGRGSEADAACSGGNGGGGGTINGASTSGGEGRSRLMESAVLEFGSTLRGWITVLVIKIPTLLAAADEAEAPAASCLALASYAVHELLPPLSQLLQQAARMLLMQPTAAWAPAVRMYVTRAGFALFVWLEYVPPPPTPPPPSPPPPQAAPQRLLQQRRGGRPAARASQRPAPAAAPRHAPTNEHLRRLLLEEVGAVPLLGAVLRLLAGHEPLRAEWRATPWVLRQLSDALSAVAQRYPEEVQRAAYACGLGATEIARGGSDDSSCGTGSGGAGAAAAECFSFWPPPALKCLAEELEANGNVEQAQSIRVLENVVQNWVTGRRVGVKCHLDFGSQEERIFASFLSPAEARGLLRVCGNPGCTNLAGDSEAELSLKACAGCGAVGYCCRECQTAHWRAGHRAACAGRRGG